MQISNAYAVVIKPGCWQPDKTRSRLRRSVYRTRLTQLMRMRSYRHAQGTGPRDPLGRR